jgi:predicted nucleotidyltransferase
MESTEAPRESVEKILARFFAGRGDVAAAYRFIDAHQIHRRRGSYVDIGVLLHPLVDHIRYEEIRLEIAEVLHVELNTAEVRVLILNDASANLCFDLVRQGEAVYSGSAEIQREFEGRIQADFLRSIDMPGRRLPGDF